MGTSLRSRARLVVLGLTLGVLLGLGTGVTAQGPFTAQIQLLLNSANAWAGLQTFPGGINVTGTCTGCGGGGGSGTVTSVAMSVPSILSVSGSPITTTGTFAVTLATQTANTVFAGATSGGAATPAFRAIVDADVPDTITIAGTNNVTWASVNKTGSALADLATRIISNLQASASSELLGVLSDETGTGVAVFATNATLVTPILGTPQSVTLTNGTGLPIGGISGLGTGVDTWLGLPSSANLLAALTTKTGTALAVFSTSPTFTAGSAVNFGAAGVSLTDDGDAGLTFKGLGNGTDEDLKLNFDGTTAECGANCVVATSSTGVTQLYFNVADFTVGASKLIDTARSNAVYLGTANNVFVLERSTKGIRFQTETPTIGGFGTGAAFVAGSSDSSGELDVGTIVAENTGTVTFGVTWSSAPRCFAQNTTTGGAAIRATTSTTVMTIAGVFATGDNLIWWCVGFKG